MITNLMLKTKIDIKADSKGKLEIGGVKLSNKEIPFIRYRLDDIEGCLDYYLKIRDTFKYSCHIIELDVETDCLEILKEIEEKYSESLIVYFMLNVEDCDLRDGLRNTKIEALNRCIEACSCNRLMIIDNTSFMHVIGYNNLKKTIMKNCQLMDKEIGVCNSPLSTEENVCLSAVMARQLIASYGEHDEYPLPSQKHEDMNTCGCIRHIVVTSDTDVKIPQNSSNNKSVKNSSDNKSKLGKAIKRFDF